MPGPQPQHIGRKRALARGLGGSRDLLGGRGGCRSCYASNADLEAIGIGDSSAFARWRDLQVRLVSLATGQTLYRETISGDKLQFYWGASGIYGGSKQSMSCGGAYAPEAFYMVLDFEYETAGKRKVVTARWLCQLGALLCGHRGRRSGVRVLGRALALALMSALAACGNRDPQMRIVGTWQDAARQLEFRRDGTVIQKSGGVAVRGQYHFSSPHHISMRFEEPFARVGEQKFGVRVGERELAICHPTDPHICQELERVTNQDVGPAAEAEGDGE